MSVDHLQKKQSIQKFHQAKEMYEMQQLQCDSCVKSKENCEDQKQFVQENK